MLDRWDGREDIVHGGLAIETGANWMLHNATSDEVIVAGVELAKKRGLKITNHCSPVRPGCRSRSSARTPAAATSTTWFAWARSSTTGCSSTVIWLTDREIDHVARAGAA